MKKQPRPITQDTSEYEIPFWKKWLEADSLQRHDMVENLPIVRDAFGLSQSVKDPQMRTQMFATFLNGYFEDLASACHTYYREQRKKRTDA